MIIILICIIEKLPYEHLVLPHFSFLIVSITWQSTFTLFYNKKHLTISNYFPFHDTKFLLFLTERYEKQNKFDVLIIYFDIILLLSLKPILVDYLNLKTVEYCRQTTLYKSNFLNLIEFQKQMKMSSTNRQKLVSHMQN